MPRHMATVGLAPEGAQYLEAGLTAGAVETLLSSRAPSTRILRGARRMRPATRSKVPTWDLAVVLGALAEAPFEPLELAEAKHLTLKMAFLLAITSLRRVGDLQALSVSP